MIQDVIHLLPDSVANQIAAGEVIQRPASVVKELVENSIDAGASSVKIIVKDAGRTLIQVIDNGCGMSVTDARMAFERHATSKINQAQDLFALQTMGFRGEALPSIAAVSEIEMRSMRSGDVAGTRIIISASAVVSQEPDVCAIGTNIMVKRLFFNLPARRKFLKKDSVELGHIVREFERLALVNTNVEFELISNDTVLHHLLPATLKKRICDLFGKTLDHQLIPISTDTSLVRIDGFVGLPANARRRGALQYFFVNGRNMRHPYFHKAVLSCYEGLISSDSQPSYFINFQVDPETIDVNIHPQKHEIKFENEQPVWQILTAAIKESLGRYNASAAIDFDTIDAPDIPAFSPESIEMPEENIDLHFNPFNITPPSSPDRPAATTSSYHRPTESTIPADWSKLYDDFSSRKRETLHSSLMNADASAGKDIDPASLPSLESEPTLIDAEKKRPGMFQLKGRYIVTPSKSGLMLIDQHRAHVRVLFDRYQEFTRRGAVPSQRLIFPEAVTLEPAQNVIALSISQLLGTMGFDIANLGGADWSINAVPAMIGTVNPSDAFINIVNAVAEADEDVEDSQWRMTVLSMARSAAIKYGAALTPDEMDSLITDLFRLSAPDYTPDGKPTLHLIDFDQITKLF